MRYCFIVPNYNHTDELPALLAKLADYKLPIIMVDDGSEASAKKIFDEQVKIVPELTLITHKQNQGKGGAVQTAIKYAHQLNFNYAIQVDADGQHNIADISLLKTLSEQYPKALISGKPVYDESIPKHRYFARFITHFWVCIETLSIKLSDSMCGFRVYPIEESMFLMSKVELGKRMDFDIEVMVRLFWQGLDVKFLPTKVIYPEHGISHFKALEDNARISWMHTRLVFGMFLRIPSLLKRHFH